MDISEQGEHRSMGDGGKSDQEAGDLMWASATLVGERGWTPGCHSERD